MSVCEAGSKGFSHSGEVGCDSIEAKMLVDAPKKDTLQEKREGQRKYL